MRNEKKILNIVGKILKWFFLFEAACFVMVLLEKIVKLSFDDFGGYFFTALACLLIAFGGYRIERFGRGEKAAKAPVKPPLKKETAPKKRSCAGKRFCATTGFQTGEGQTRYCFKWILSLRISYRRRFILGWKRRTCLPGAAMEFSGCSKSWKAHA